MDADGGNPQQLTDDSELIDPNNSDVLFWSEDGRSIYYPVWDRSEMFAVALDGSGLPLMEGREAALILRRFQDHLNLSSDGTKGAYVFLRVGLAGQASLGVPAGQALLRIWSTGEDGYTDNIPLSDLPNFDPSWNPDISDVPPYPLTWAPNSMRIAFTSYTTNSTREIWAVDIDGSNLVNLTNGLGGHSPAWQPASLLLPLRASKPSRGDRSNRCFQQAPINRASCVGAVRSASRPYVPFCTNPTLSLHKRKIRADSRNRCTYKDPARRLFSSRSR